MALSERERALRQRLRNEFPHYAAKCLKIRTKSGAIVSLVLNRAQLYIDSRLEAQRVAIGKVRALILKGRQQGCSTYVGGRFYHKVTQWPGQQAFILTHEQPATENLFGMTARFHDHCPALVKPSTGAANAKELCFDALDSGYTVGTAGTKATGRSKTIQLLHGSEVAFWTNAPSHFAGVVQAVPDLRGTEIILESTANGLGNEFHQRWQQAEAGIGDYIAIFVPWFWDEGYRREVDEDFVLTAEEEEYAQAYGLDVGQMAWRRAKIAELKDPLLFMQEYPATAAEAFQSTGHDSFIKPADVLKARKASCKESGPLVIGADPARFGDDRFSIAWRRGRKVSKIESRGGVAPDGAKHPGIDTVQGANWIKQIIDRDKPKRVFVDVGGIGAGVVDILHNWGAPYDAIVVPVNFGSAPQDEAPIDSDGRQMGGYRNRRAEMWGRSRDWLRDVRGADIPDSDALHADACGPGYGYGNNQEVKLEAKEQMRARGVRSPDEWDAVALTFAEPVNEASGSDRIELPDYGIV
jgi:hypothetical protein